ncbi:MAG: transposase [Ruminococcaceae bacterium]|nr:transposase [Oscillospiraceae bacterium]
MMKMSRSARKLSKTGLYHIIFKGIGSQNIFEEPSDYEKLKEIIMRVKYEMQFNLYAYCMMTNHVHLFIKEQNAGEISKIMTKILSHYATWFNRKYQRIGALFANRYNSEPVEDERYYLSLIRYIHQNPVKAHMVDNPGSYPYSSYNDYAKNISDITDIDFLLDMLNNDRKKAINEFIELNTVSDGETYEITDSRKTSPANIRRIIMSMIDGKEIETIKRMEKETRNQLIKILVNEKGISKSALERATGISRGTIIKICKEDDKLSQKNMVPQFLD